MMDSTFLKRLFREKKRGGRYKMLYYVYEGRIKELLGRDYTIIAIKEDIERDLNIKLNDRSFYNIIKKNKDRLTLSERTEQSEENIEV